MPMHRSNKAPRDTDKRTETAWFQARVKRDKNRSKMAKASRKKNRK